MRLREKKNTSHGLIQTTTTTVSGEMTLGLETKCVILTVVKFVKDNGQLCVRGLTVVVVVQSWPLRRRR